MEEDKMNKKSFCTFMISACSAALISGCGDVQETTTESKSAETVETTVAKTTEEAEAETSAETQESTEEVEEDAKEEPSEEKNVDLQEVFNDAQYMEIGTTGYFIKVPKSYYQGEVKDNERKDDMIAYYKSDEFLMDFDVYQYPNEGRDLYAYTETEAREYKADGITEVTINDTELGLYYSTESYEGEEGEFLVANYIFVSGDDFGELSFWQDGDEAEELTRTIINSITTTPEEAPAEVRDQGDNPDYSFLMSEEYQKMAQAMIEEKVANTELTLDRKDSSADVNSLEDGHFITKDEVQCREVKITCGDGANGEMMYWFGLYLYNETGEPKDFDPTKFLIETKSGQLVYPCLMSDDLITVKSDTQTSQSFTLVDTKDLAPDEEADIYYDGVLISTVKVSK
jgi:hypothetical protein